MAVLEEPERAREKARESQREPERARERARESQREPERAAVLRAQRRMRRILVYESCKARCAMHACSGLECRCKLFFCFYSTYYFMVTGVQYTSLILQ